MNKQSASTLSCNAEKNNSLPWSSKLGDAHLLCQMLLDGKINLGATPKEVHEMREEFCKYNLKKFHQGLYNLKNETGFNLCHSLNQPRDEDLLGKLKESLCQGMKKIAAQIVTPFVSINNRGNC